MQLKPNSGLPLYLGPEQVIPLSPHLSASLEGGAQVKRSEKENIWIPLLHAGVCSQSKFPRKMKTSTAEEVKGVVRYGVASFVGVKRNGLIVPHHHHHHQASQCHVRTLQRTRGRVFKDRGRTQTLEQLNMRSSNKTRKGNTPILISPRLRRKMTKKKPTLISCWLIR